MAVAAAAAAVVVVAFRVVNVLVLLKKEGVCLTRDNKALALRVYKVMPADDPKMTAAMT